MLYNSVVLFRTLIALLKTMRPRQWVKNALLFAAIVFDEKIGHLSLLLHTLAGFALFCLLASTVYLINDLMDVQADRQHPQKRKRPIASGQLPVWIAVTVASLFVLIIFPLAYRLSPFFALVCLGYFILNLAYSRWLKHTLLLDVFILASFYVLRVVAGVTLVQVERFSPWLYVVTTLGALFIGIGKRRAELVLLADGANAHRRVLEGYSLPLLDQFITIVSTMTVIAYSLYTFLAPNVPANHTMMLTITFAMYGIFRYLYLIQVQNSGGAPEDIFFSDRPLQVTIALWGLTVLAIFYLS